METDSLAQGTLLVACLPGPAGHRWVSLGSARTGLGTTGI